MTQLLNVNIKSVADLKVVGLEAHFGFGVLKSKLQERYFIRYVNELKNKKTCISTKVKKKIMMPLF